MKELHIYMEHLPNKILDYWHRENEYENVNINRLLHTPLVEINHNHVEYLLANKVSITYYVKNNVLCNKAKWSINNSYKWENGDSVVVDDFILWHKIKKSKYNLKGEKNPWQTSEIVKIDENTFEVNYSPAYYYADSNDSLLAVPSTILEKYWNDVEDGILSAEEFFYNLDTYKYKNSRFNGKYVLKSYTNQTIILEPHPYNAKERRGYDKIIIKQIGSSSDLNDISFTQNIVIDVTNFEIQDKLQNLNSEFKTVSYDNNTWIHIDFNYRNEFLSNKVYREIIALSLDRDDLIDGERNLRKSYSFLHDQHSAYSVCDNVKTLSDVQNELLDMGWELDKDGIFCKENKLMEFTLVTLSGINYIDKMVQKIKNQLLKSGIKLNIKQVDFETFYSDIYYYGEKLKFDMILHAWAGNPFFEKGEMYVSYINSMSNIPSYENQYCGENISAYNNTEYDLLFEKLNFEIDNMGRVSILKELNAIFHKDVIAIPICYKIRDLFIKGDVPIVTDAFLGNYTNNL